jgi:hypothetical protein
MTFQRPGEATQLGGLRGYLEAIRLFSRNARLYLSHPVWSHGCPLLHLHGFILDLLSARGARLGEVQAL